MKEIQISKFKATCLAVLDEVQRTGEPAVVTRRGVAVARIEPERVLPVPGVRWVGSWANAVRCWGMWWRRTATRRLGWGLRGLRPRLRVSGTRGGASVAVEHALGPAPVNRLGGAARLNDLLDTHIWLGDSASRNACGQPCK